MSRSKFVAQPFVNNIGQTLNPGDTVVYVGTSWNHTRVKTGTFDGVYIRTFSTYDRETKQTSTTERISAIRISGIKSNRLVKNQSTGKYEYVDHVRTACLELKRAYKIADLNSTQVVDLISKVI